MNQEQEIPKCLTELKEETIEMIKNCNEYRVIYFLNCFLELHKEKEVKNNEQ